MQLYVNDIGMTDRREEILNIAINLDNAKKGILSMVPDVFPSSLMDAAKYAMDEYMKETCLELLEYMAKHNVLCMEEMFCYKGRWITKEQLFENFL
jgi:hypothetical protein